MTDEQRTVMIQGFADTDNGELAKRLGVDVKTISLWGRILGLDKSRAYRERVRRESEIMRGPNVIRAGRLPQDIEAFMLKYFATTRNEDMAAHIGVDKKTVHRWSKRLGLVKDRGSALQPLPAGLPPLSVKPKMTKDEVLEIIREIYPDGDVWRICEKTGYSFGVIENLAHLYGIRRHLTKGTVPSVRKSD